MSSAKASQKGFALLISSSLLLLAALWSQFSPPSETLLLLNEVVSLENPGTSEPLPLLLSKNSADFDDPKTLNIHVVPHTHDDVGWLKTVDQYFYGSNNTIQNACVKDILDSVIPALLENEHRTFVYVEMKFFSKWWQLQSDTIQDKVRWLIANQQLSFANGGWCMHDEAATHFIGMIDQTTLGHQFLANELGVTPRVGWQLDPFGHSATQASLFTSKVGFDAIYFGRIDYQDRQYRQETRNCEGFWNASHSLDDTNVFWGLTGSYYGQYSPPPGFCFDILCSDKDQLYSLGKEAMRHRILKFLREMKTQSDQSRGNHIMITMGEDFNFQIASRNYANLDALISNTMYFQQNGAINITKLFGPRFDNVKVFYSSPEYYTDAKYRELKEGRQAEDNATLSELNYTTKKDDFFPYANAKHSMWTGYFTSRASLKRFERVASSFLMAARQIFTMEPSQSDIEGDEEALFALEDTVGVVQHHDGVSGTAKQHVAFDYAKALQNGIDKVSNRLSQKLRSLISGETDNSTILSDLSYCPLLNESICQVSENATMHDGIDLYVVVYNSLATNRSSIIRVPVSRKVPYEITPMSDPNATQIISPTIVDRGKKQKIVLAFVSGQLPPIGASVFRIRAMNPEIVHDNSHLSPPLSNLTMERLDHENLIQLSNGIIKAWFWANSGTLAKIINIDDGMSLGVSQTWGYFESFDASLDGNKDDPADELQNSGAYIFRPSDPDGLALQLKPLKSKFVNTSVGWEVHVEYQGNWLKTITRVLQGAPYLEVEYTVGPIPVEDGRGKEVITRFQSSIENDGVFYTDSNAREFIRRERDYRSTWNYTMYEPVAGNYYPVNAAMFISDSNVSLAVATDRTQGGASLHDGFMELMVQRRILVDDHYGVGEPLNETTGGTTPYPPYGKAQRVGDGAIVTGKHRILIGPPKGAKLARSMMDDVFAEPVVFLGSAPADASHDHSLSSFSLLKQALPSNIMMVTLRRYENKILLRLAHQYGMNEDPQDLSQPVTLNLTEIFPNSMRIKNAVEKTLSGAEDYKSWKQRRYHWSVGKSKVKSSLTHAMNFDPQNITIGPMDIRTIELTIEAAGSQLLEGNTMVE